MMFSGKLFAIISAVLVVAVNGSPVDPAPAGQPQGNQNQAGQPQTSATQGGVHYCSDATNCPEVTFNPNVCEPIPDDYKKKIGEFKFETFKECKVYSDADCTQDPHTLPLVDAVPDNFYEKPLHCKCTI